MIAHGSGPRHVVERRLRSDRRRGLERRIGERRLETVAVPVNRRAAPDNRMASERRGPLPRRTRSGRFPALTLVADITLDI